MSRIVFAVFFLLAFTPAGAFGAEGNSCNGFAGQSCGEGLFCKLSIEQACGAGDQTGVCTVRPEICTRQYMPVCGCDGETYSNACVAHSAGASVAYVGTCRMADDAICEQVISCGLKDGQYFEYPTPCAARRDGATGVIPREGAACPATR